MSRHVRSIAAARNAAYGRGRDIFSRHPPVLDDAKAVTKPNAATVLVALVVAFCGLLVSTDAGALLGLFVMERVIVSQGPAHLAVRTHAGSGQTASIAAAE